MGTELYPKNEGTTLPVDLIRTVAIVFVILLHAAIEPNLNVELMSPEGVQLWWTSNVYASLAASAVPLFVMLTGALLLQPSKVNEPINIFFKKRLSRIGLPFIFWGAAFFAWRFFVNGEALTSDSILQGVLAGPYFHFWFLYLLIGLYLITPLLRVVSAYADWKIIKYFLLVWFAGTAAIPLLSLYENISPQAVWFEHTVFIMIGMVGYFVAGAYVAKLRVRSSILIAILFLGFISTAIATYLVVGNIGERLNNFFYDASSITMIATSIALFLVLSTVSFQKLENRFPRANRLFHLISENTLPIYLFHVMVLEALQKGYLGFKLSVTTMNPIVAVPLITVVTLFLCLAIIVPLKKIPRVKSIIG